MAKVNEPFVISGSNHVSAQILVTEDIDERTNTSEVSVAVSLGSAGYYGASTVYYLSGSVKVGSDTLVSMSSVAGYHRVTFTKKDVYYPIVAVDGREGSPWEKTVAHDTDGSKTITVSINISGYTASGNGASGFNVSGSATVQLTKIPRASTIGATDAYIGSAATISVGRKSSSYTHSIEYKFGNLSGYVTDTGSVSASEVRFSATSIAFLIPDSFYEQIPRAKSGTCTLTCKTYSGSAMIGSATSCGFTVTALADRCSPVVTGQVVDTNASTVALTGNSSVLVRYKSTAQCTISATGRGGATISSKSIEGAPVTGNSRTIDNVETGSFDFSATDSRGYTGNDTVVRTVIPYVVLTCVVSGKRTEPTTGNAVLTIKGNFFNGSFGSSSNSLSLRYRMGTGNWVSISPSISGNSYTATVSLAGLDYTQSYSFTVEASDKLTLTTTPATVNKGIPVFDWGEEDFAFHVPVRFLAGGSGFAPAGYGYGGYTISIGTSLSETAAEAALETIYADMESVSTKLITYTDSTGWRWFGILSKSSANNGSFVAHSAINGGSQIQKTKNNGSWKPLEWLNPPMMPGVEYRTAERWDNKPVYRKLVKYTNNTALSGDALYSIPHGISKLDRSYGVGIKCRTVGYQIPYFGANETTAVTGCTATDIELKTLGSTSWSAGRVWYFEMSYVKTE